MRFLFVAIAMLFTSSLALAQDVMTPQQFRDLYRERVIAATPGITVTPLEGMAMRMTPPAGAASAEMTVNLDRAYGEYAQAPDQLETILTRWVRLATTAPEGARQPDRIVRVVRTMDHVTGYTQSMSQQSQEEIRLVWRHLAGDLVEMIAFDSADAIQFATEASLTDLGLTTDQAWTLGLRNLPERLGTLAQEQLAPGVILIGGGNGLAPSVLITALWCGAPQNADALYLVVDRDSFLRAERPVGVEAITRVRDGMIRDGSAFSGTLLACEGGQLQALPN